MDLLEELSVLLVQLREARVPYALCGGLAASVYGITRPTDDIDILIPGPALPVLRRAVMRIGYDHECPVESRADGKILISNFFKTSPHGKGSVILDAVHVTPWVEEAAWEGRKTLKTEMGEVSIVSREGLAALLRLRNTPADQGCATRLEVWD